MSGLPSQTIEEAPASYSWTAKHRIGGVWKSSKPVEFAIAPISAVTVRANALTVSAQAAAMALAGLISDEELSADYIIPAAFDFTALPF